MEIRFTDGSYADGGERIMLDPTVYPDWQIGAAAERALPPVEEEILTFDPVPQDFLE